jgi:hypothetical protein
MINDERPILQYARALAKQMNEDVKLASNRVEHVRLTARANEAAQLVNMLEEQLSVPETN